MRFGWKSKTNKDDFEENIRKHLEWELFDKSHWALPGSNNDMLLILPKIVSIPSFTEKQYINFHVKILMI